MAADNPLGVAYRGHIQDLGDYPADGSWVDSPTIIGTEGQSKRIEGFEIKLTGTIPANLQNDLELRYNVHVQNKGWLYDENDTTNWPKDGDYAGTRGESLRIEAVKIVLTDSDGKPVSGYSVQYRGHVQNVGDLPADESQWIADGDQLGTVGSSLRLEALLVKVVKNQTDLTAYQALLTAIGKTVESDYTAASWETLQKALTDNAETANNNQTEVDKATTAIQKAYDGLVKKAAAVVYDKAGTYGPETGTEVINGDVIVKADGITLRNLHINGDLYVGAEQVAAKTEENTAETTNASQVVVNNTDYNTIIQNLYIAYFTRPAAGTHLTITGSQPQAFAFFLPGGTQFTVTTPGGGIGTGAPMQITAGASGGPAGGISVGGTIGSLSLLTPGTQVSLAPGCLVQLLSLQSGALNCGILTPPTAVIQNALVQGSGAVFSGTGTIQHADIQANGASFATRPDAFTVAAGVVSPPSMPAPPEPSGGGSGGYTPTQSQPVISPSGAVTFPITVTISSQGADAIYYTTDGSDPSMVSGALNTTKVIGNSAAITVAQAMTVKALAIRAGYYNSAVASIAFTQMPSADLSGISISPATANYSFTPGTYDYANVTVANDVEEITITPSGSGVITVDGTVVASGTAPATPIAVSFKEEKTILVTTQEQGKALKTYTIKLTPSSGTVTPIIRTLLPGLTVTSTTLDLNSSGIFGIKPGSSGVLSKIQFTSGDTSVIASSAMSDGVITILKDGTTALNFTEASVILGGTTYDNISLNNATITVMVTTYLTKVNGGAATVEEYAKAGITGVVAENLAGINAAVVAARDVAPGAALNKTAVQAVVAGYLAKANTFAVAFENNYSKIQTDAFSLSITAAKDSYGNLLSGSRTVTVSSDKNGEVFNQTVAFDNGAASVPITLSQIGNHGLTVTVAGMTPYQDLTVTVYSKLSYLTPDTVRDYNVGSYGTAVAVPPDNQGTAVLGILYDTFANKGLTSVTLPAGLASISASAFANNNLTSVVIPDNVMSLGDAAFAGKPLTTITIRDGVSIPGTGSTMGNLRRGF